MRRLLLVLLVSACDRVFVIDNELPPDLLAHYEMERIVDNTVEDSSGHGNRATCVDGQCPSIDDIGGPVGGAARFNGDGEHLNAKPDPAFQTPDAFTVAAWLRVDTLPIDTFGCVVTKPLGLGEANSWAICVFAALGRDTGTLLFASKHDVIDQIGLDGITANSEHHVTSVWDGATNTKRLYVNGVLIGEKTLSSGAEFDDAAVLIGADNNGAGPTHFFHGLIDEIRIYDRVLAADEVFEIANP